MTDAHDRVHQVHEFLDDVDWGAIEGGVLFAGAAGRYLRRHPWMLMAAGATLAAAGGLLTWKDHRDARRGAAHLSPRRDHAQRGDGSRGALKAKGGRHGMGAERKGHSDSDQAHLTGSFETEYTPAP